MGIIDVAGDPLAKKEPSPLSMRTGDMLAAIENAAPTQAGTVLRARGDIERKRAQNEKGIALLQRQREMELVEQSGQEALMSLPEWVKTTHPDLWAKRHGKVTARENQLVKEGYTMYLVFQKAKQEQAFNRQQIATGRAREASYGRSQRPTSPASYIGRQLGTGGPIHPQAEALWRAKHSRLPGIAAKERTATEAVGAKERIATEAVGAKRGIATEKAGAAKERYSLDRASREGIAAGSVASRERIAVLKEGATPAKPLVTDASIRKVIVAGKNIDKVAKGGEKADFRTWMEDSYLPIARSITPERRAAIFKAMGDNVPSETKLLGMFQVPTGKPARLFGLIGATPPSEGAIEGGFDELDYLLEALKLRGASETKLDQLRAFFLKQLRDSRETPGG